MVERQMCSEAIGDETAQLWKRAKGTGLNSHPQAKCSVTSWRKPSCSMAQVGFLGLQNIQMQLR